MLHNSHCISIYCIYIGLSTKCIFLEANEANSLKNSLLYYMSMGVEKTCISAFTRPMKLHGWYTDAPPRIITLYLSPSEAAATSLFLRVKFANPNVHAAHKH